MYLILHWAMQKSRRKKKMGKDNKDISIFSIIGERLQQDICT